MADASFLPRVNFEVMQRYAGRRVLLVGKVHSQNNDVVVLKTSDDADVSVQTNPIQPADWSSTQFVEVLGTVVDAKTIQEDSHVALRGPDVDMRLYNEMVKLANGKYASLFTS